MANTNHSRREFMKKSALGALGGVLLGTNSITSRGGSAEQTRLVYVGTYTSGKSEGIYLCRLDYGTGELKPAGTVKGVSNPSYLALDHHRKYLYAVNEETEFDGKKSGAVSAFAIDPKTGALRFLNQRASLGGAPCYVTVDNKDTFILVANYVGGNVSVLPVKQSGGLGASVDLEQHAGSSVNHDRQEGPHAHCIVLDPTGRYAYSCDLGTDKIMIYQFDSKSGKLSPARQPWAAVKAGAGPRHLTFHPNGLHAYVINELDATVSAFEFDPASGALKELQNLPTLPTDFKGENTSADIHITPDGKFLYCSNRGYDHLAAFRIDNKNGRLEFLGHESTLGKTPRNFVIDPTGTFLLVANQNSDNIVSFRIDPSTGNLKPTGHVATVPSPVCLKF